MPSDFDNKRLFKEIDRALENYNLDQALRLARECYNKDNDYTQTQLLLLSVAFSATVRWGAGLDLEEKRLAHQLWQQATHAMSSQMKERAANQGIRLAEIYTHRREPGLAWNALRTVKGYVVFGAVSMRFNRAVDAYVSFSGKSDSDLWIN